MLATFTALLDRYLIGLLLVPIRAEFAISDTEVSLLQGLAFGLFYSVLGLPFGRLVDRGNRRNIIMMGALLWSVTTICCGLAENYTQLFLARLGVGFGEACLAPAAYSLITDLFPPRIHGRALALFTLSSVVGGGGSFIIGAQALGYATRIHWNLPYFGVLAPWRLTFLLIGSPGLLVALMMLTIREPSRHAEQGVARHASLVEVGRFMRSIRKPLVTLILANCAMIITGTGIVGWMAVFLARTYGVPVTKSGHWIGLLIIISALSGGSLAGWIADSGFIARQNGGKLVVMAIACGAAIPLAVSFPLMPTVVTSMALFLAYSIAYNLQACSAPSILQDILPNQFKGQVTAIYWLCVGIVGYGGGSTAVALITDHVFRNDGMLRYSLIAVAVPALGTALICALVGRSSYQSAVDRLSAARLALSQPVRLDPRATTSDGG